MGSRERTTGDKVSAIWESEPLVHASHKQLIPLESEIPVKRRKAGKEGQDVNGARQGQKRGPLERPGRGGRGVGPLPLFSHEGHVCPPTLPVLRTQSGLACLPAWMSLSSEGGRTTQGSTKRTQSSRLLRTSSRGSPRSPQKG